jgi:hypothetical protein
VFGLQILVILTISSTGPNAGDLSFLFHKHPERVQEFALSFGRVLVFYPRYDATVCEVALVLDLDPLRLAGRGERVGLPLYPYVNDRLCDLSCEMRFLTPAKWQGNPFVL